MNKKTERILIGTVFPLVVSCAMIAFAFTLGRDDFEGFTVVGSVFMMGVLVMGLPWLPKSNMG